MKPVIRVENLSKRYRVGTYRSGDYKTIREVLTGAVATPLSRLWNRTRGVGHETNQANAFWALKDVTFEVQPGEVVGIIGRNGAGKSTLLKILSRITEPTGGRAVIRGRVGSLLEVGTGFHNELTGRENIYLNGSILGMSGKEIGRKFDEIVAFAEMEQFLDTPVKRYSSGMYVRLAFAVAAHLDLEVLLVDEILAVGDLEFQKKSLQKMGDIAQSGRTVLFVSHNLGIIHRLCGRAVLLRQGRIQCMGETPGVIQAYLCESLKHEGRWERPDSLAAGQDVCLRRAEILGKDRAVTGIVPCDESFCVSIEYEVLRPLPNFEIGIALRNGQGVTVFVSLDSDTGCWQGRGRPPGMYRSVCEIPAHLLAPGTYFLTCAAHIINQQTFDTQHDALAFEVAETGCIRFKRNDRRAGVVMPVLGWDIARVS
jgi:lipopolysaccharide transport system ATP-binding protein